MFLFAGVCTWPWPNDNSDTSTSKELFVFTGSAERSLTYHDRSCLTRRVCPQCAKSSEVYYVQSVTLDSRPQPGHVLGTSPPTNATGRRCQWIWRRENPLTKQWRFVAGKSVCCGLWMDFFLPGWSARGYWFRTLRMLAYVDTLPFFQWVQCLMVLVWAYGIQITWICIA